jgi:uncharacterized protein (TIGR04222 family)
MPWLPSGLIAEMPGPLFLALYAAVIVATLVACYLMKPKRDASSDLPPLLPPEQPDAYELAYLRGGENEVVRIVLFDMIQRGYLEVVDEKLLIFTKGQKLRQKPGHPDPRHLSQLGQAVFAWFSEPRSPADVFRSSPLVGIVQEHCRSSHRRLEKESLFCLDEVKSACRWLAVVGTVVILGLGAYKLVVALVKGKSNVGFLIMMGIVATAILWKVCASHRLSHRGREYLDRLQATFQGLKGRASAPAAGPDPTLVLLVGLFGVEALAGGSYDYFKRMFAQSAGGGGCGGGGCGGGGCGGGGCGGCGGCGG